MTPLLDGTAVGLLVTGATVGGVLAVLAMGIARYVPRWRGSAQIPLGGLLLTVPLVVVTFAGSAVGPSTTAGLSVLLITGYAIPRHLPPLVRGAASVPGAAILAIGVDGVAFLLIVVVVPIVSTAIATFEAGHDYEHGLATMCAAIATGGAFLTVPDTEHVALLAGAGTVVGVLVLLEPRLALGGSSLAFTGAFVWAVSIDGAARATSVVGALGALGLLAIDPAVRLNVSLYRGLLTYLPTIGARRQLVVTAGIQTVLAVFIARIAGIGSDVTLAIVLALGAWTVVGVALGKRASQLQ